MTQKSDHLFPWQRLVYNRAFPHIQAVTVAGQQGWVPIVASVRTQTTYGLQQSPKGGAHLLNIGKKTFGNGLQQAKRYDIMELFWQWGQGYANLAGLVSETTAMLWTLGLLFQFQHLSIMRGRLAPRESELVEAVAGLGLVGC